MSDIFKGLAFLNYLTLNVVPLHIYSTVSELSTRLI